MSKQKVKQKIEAFEYYANGLDKLSCCEVVVRNLRLRKDKAIADVLLRMYMDSEPTVTRYNNLEYPYVALGV